MGKKRNKNMKIQNTEKKARKGGGGHYRAVKKLPLTLLLAFTLPLTVCFFGPFETYCGNMEEFLFSLGDFLPYCIGYRLCCCVVAQRYGVLSEILSEFWHECP